MIGGSKIQQERERPMAFKYRSGARAAVVTICLTILAKSLLTAAFGQPLSKGTPESEGLASERLNRLTEVFQHGIDQGDMPGAVVAVARDGRLVYEHAFGFQNREEKIP
jgi:CubicO group peptidase (beta-lactamase class C family)